jgi:hypothetical protein
LFKERSLVAVVVVVVVVLLLLLLGRVGSNVVKEDNHSFLFCV